MPAARAPGPQPEPVELLELRVLDGANRFSTRPAVKIEFAGPAGEPEVSARTAGAAVQRLHRALGMPAPRVTFRVSADSRRSVAAYPWRRRTISQAIAAAAVRIALGKSRDSRELRQLRAVADGTRPDVPRPRIPVVAITGTNGKSTTTRLIAYVAGLAGRQVGMTNSDGIFVRGLLVEAGDWTGYGGAGRVLSEPALDLAVLETARGGILLRGIGYAHNDVAVVTNISPDHLGLQGIDTLDELAEVKAAVVRITRAAGWAVLNADDARVWDMRHHTHAHWYPFSLDPASPAVSEALSGGGRAAVLDAGWLVLRHAGRPPTRIARVEDVPVTVAGISRFNISNALAAAAACDALGFRPAQIRAGLHSFARDRSTNPGRLNLYQRDGRLALVDFAHNEAGLAGLLEVCRVLAGPRGRVRLAMGTAGDRADEILRGMGRLAGAGVDDLAICEKAHYLRGRSRAEMNRLFRAGAREGGYRGVIKAFPGELTALQALVARSRRGDVATVMSHLEREEIFDWLAGEGFVPMEPDDLARLVRPRNVKPRPRTPRLGPR